MSKTLAERLKVAKEALTTIETSTSKHGGKLMPEVENHFKSISAFAADVDHWLGMLAARTAARSFLNGLEQQADGSDEVTFGGMRTKFQHVRMIGVQAYLATEWALADRLAALAGNVLCVRNSLNDPKNLPQLVSHFVAGKGPEGKTAALTFYSIRQSFGWPIAISYALRNHFVHDGGQLAGVDFFDGPTAAAAFKISADGWARLEERARTYGADVTHHRIGAAWKASAGDNLRAVLDACEREIDDALGVLVGSACHSLAGHVGFVLGED